MGKQDGIISPLKMKKDVVLWGESLLGSGPLHELPENALDVACHCACGDVELARDHFSAHTFRNHRENLALTEGEAFMAIPGGPGWRKNRRYVGDRSDRLEKILLSCSFRKKTANPGVHQSCKPGVRTPLSCCTLSTTAAMFPILFSGCHTFPFLAFRKASFEQGRDTSIVAEGYAEFEWKGIAQTVEKGMSTIGMMTSRGSAACAILGQTPGGHRRQFQGGYAMPVFRGYCGRGFLRCRLRC